VCLIAQVPRASEKIKKKKKIKVKKKKRKEKEIDKEIVNNLGFWEK
jgi:hypothetical protein